jgi:hypothetical protein
VHRLRKRITLGILRRVPKREPVWMMYLISSCGRLVWMDSTNNGSVWYQYVLRLIVDWDRCCVVLRSTFVR